MDAQTILFSQGSGLNQWRLETSEPTLINRLNQLVADKISKWTVVDGAAEDGYTWAYRHRFNGMSEASEALTRILMRMDDAEFELKSLGEQLGWSVKRPESDRKVAV